MTCTTWPAAGTARHVMAMLIAPASANGDRAIRLINCRGVGCSVPGAIHILRPAVRHLSLDGRLRNRQPFGVGLHAAAAVCPSFLVGCIIEAMRCGRRRCGPTNRTSPCQTRSSNRAGMDWGFRTSCSVARWLVLLYACFTWRPAKEPRLSYAHPHRQLRVPASGWGWWRRHPRYRGGTRQTA